MPISLTVDEIEPGMRLFDAIVRDEQTLLPAGKMLEDWEINTLRRRFPDMRVRIGDPVLDELVEFEDQSDSETLASNVSKRTSQMLGSVREKIGSRTSLSSGDIVGLQTAVQDLIRNISEHPSCAAILMKSGEWNSYLQQHSGNVFYLSLLIGNAIREFIYKERKRLSYARDLSPSYGMDLTPLGLGALVHDIGMIPIDHVYRTDAKLAAEDCKAIHEHPTVGAELLPPDFDAVARMIVRTHHENFNGTGYPNKLEPDRMHVFTRIIRVADAFDAATSSHVYKKAKTPARVLYEMLFGAPKVFYDERIVKILMTLVQPFPIGAKIQLNCGRFGVVCRHNRKAPFRPTIVIAFDENGKKLKKTDLQSPIDLSQNRNVRLVTFGNEDLTYLNRDAQIDEWNDPKAHSLAEEEDALMSFAYP